MVKLILNFKSKTFEKIKNPKNYLGGKGVNLATMRKLRLPVPSGFTISTSDTIILGYSLTSGIINPNNISSPTYSARDNQNLKTHTLNKLLYSKKLLMFFTLNFIFLLSILSRSFSVVSRATRFPLFIIAIRSHISSAS